GALVSRLLPAESRVETIHSTGYRAGKVITDEFGVVHKYRSYDDLNPVNRLEMQSGIARVLKGPTENLKSVQRDILLPNEVALKMHPLQGRVARWARFHPDTEIWNGLPRFGNAPPVRPVFPVFEAGEIPYKLEVAGQPFCGFCREFIESVGG